MHILKCFAQSAVYMLHRAATDSSIVCPGAYRYSQEPVALLHQNVKLEIEFSNLNPMKYNLRHSFSLLQCVVQCLQCLHRI